MPSPLEEHAWNGTRIPKWVRGGGNKTKGMLCRSVSSQRFWSLASQTTEKWGNIVPEIGQEQYLNWNWQSELCLPALRTATSFPPHLTLQQPYNAFQTWTYWTSWSWRSGVAQQTDLPKSMDNLAQMLWWQFYFKMWAHKKEITLIPFLPTPTQLFWDDHTNPNSTATGLSRRLQKILFSITSIYAYKDMQIDVYTHMHIPVCQLHKYFALISTSSPLNSHKSQLLYRHAFLINPKLPTFLINPNLPEHWEGRQVIRKLKHLKKKKVILQKLGFVKKFPVKIKAHIFKQKHLATLNAYVLKNKNRWNYKLIYKENHVYLFHLCYMNC